MMHILILILSYLIDLRAREYVASITLLPGIKSLTSTSSTPFRQTRLFGLIPGHQIQEDKLIHLHMSESYTRLQRRADARKQPLRILTGISEYTTLNENLTRQRTEAFMFDRVF